MGTREPGPIRAARMLRADLRRAREVKGVTQVEVAEAMEWSLSKVARIENGDVGIGQLDLRALLIYFGMGEAATREMLRRNEVSRTRSWWHEFRADMTPALASLVGMETEVDQLREYALTAVPDLFQTWAYAEARRESVGDSERLLDLRVLRQEHVLDRADPPELNLVLDESVLYRSVGAPKAMAAQIRRLAELARRPHIHVRVMPFERESYGGSDFLLVGQELVYVAWLHGAEATDSAARIHLALERFDRLWGDALDPDRTGQLLHRVAAGYESGRPPRPWLWD